MKFLSQNTSLLLLLLSSVARATVEPPVDITQQVTTGTDAVPYAKGDPVDGRGGQPHGGPWVKPEAGTVDDESNALPELKARGPESGISVKLAAREAPGSETVVKTGNLPETPKDIPPVPQSEQDKILYGKDTAKDAHTSGSSNPKSPDAARHDTPQLGSNDPLPTTPNTLDKDVGIIRPFHSFILSFTMILFSEVGDKTFLVAALMAMKHDRMVVFSAAFGALLVMTVLSAVLGHAVPALLSKRLTGFLASILFFVFGAKLLREGMAMDPDEGVTGEMHEVERELAEKEKEKGQHGAVSPYALEMGLAGRNSRPKSRFPTPPRSPSTSPPRSPGSPGTSIMQVFHGLENLCSLLLSPAWVQTFVMTFLGEWGDRSQIATVAMAAGQDYWWVTIGAVAGHGICTAVAVIGGKAIAGRVSLRVVTIGGAVAFLVFGLIYLLEALYS